LTDDEMARLVNLSPDDFEHREWVALEWARTWALSRGEVSDSTVTAEFESIYTEQERRDILAVVTVMDFANRFMNSTSGEVLLVDGAPAQV
jgi:alkylhydroperoxidase family enzyme